MQNYPSVPQLNGLPWDLGPLATFLTRGLGTYFRPLCVIKQNKTKKCGLKLFPNVFALSLRKNSELVLKGHTPQKQAWSLPQTDASCGILDRRVPLPAIPLETGPPAKLIWCTVLWVEVIVFTRHYSCLVYLRATPNNVSLAIKGFIRHEASLLFSFRGKRNRFLLMFTTSSSNLLPTSGPC